MNDIIPMYFNQINSLHFSISLYWIIVILIRSELAHVGEDRTGLVILLVLVSLAAVHRGEVVVLVRHHGLQVKCQSLLVAIYHYIY